VIAAMVAAVVARRYPDVAVARGEVTVVVGREELLPAITWFRDEVELQMDFLSSITATHWPGRDPAFWVDYELRSMPLRHRLRMKVALTEGDAVVPSLTSLFPTANWHERETFDFFGISFEGHPDLTRILLPAEWDGHPLRKDEPLGGVPTWFRGATMPPIDQRGMA
jgi:NADH-quinone oxidoreductase subunit C